MALFSRFPDLEKFREDNLWKEILKTLSKQREAQTTKDAVVAHVVRSFINDVESRLVQDMGQQKLYELFLEFGDRRYHGVESEWGSVTLPLRPEQNKFSAIPVDKAREFFEVTHHLTGRWDRLRNVMRRFYGAKPAQRVFETLWDAFSRAGFQASLAKWKGTDKRLDKDRLAEMATVEGGSPIHHLPELPVDYPSAVLNRKPSSTPQKAATVFIGHGPSGDWRALKDFVSIRLKLDWDEFNREAVAGISTTERLQQMLSRATVALLVMAGEDQSADGTMRARENVVHELGLFQGRLGLNRTIILLEDGCSPFSNIVGLAYIKFPRGNISGCFEEVRLVLEREGLL